MPIKRRAEYVPRPHRTELNKLSKADLLEIAYSLAVLLTGNEDANEAYQIVRAEYVALCLNSGRKPVKLDVVQLDKTEGDDE